MIIDENAYYKIRTGVAPCGIKKYQQRTVVRSGAWVLKNKAQKANRVYVGNNGNMGTIIEKVEK